MSKRLVLTYLGLALFVLAVLEVPLGITFARTEERSLAAKVERDAATLATLAQTDLEERSPGRTAALRTIAERYERETGGRVVIVDARGRALVDTEPLTSGPTPFASRPEIGRALAGEVAIGTRHSRTLDQDLLFVAVPVAAGGVVHGAVRITYPTSAVDARVRRFVLMLVAVGLVVLAGAWIVGYRFAGFVARPLRELQDVARRVGDGELSIRARTGEGPPEVRALAAGLNDTVMKLEQLVRSQEEFVADAAHQLRSPLAALRLRLENMQRERGAGQDDGLADALTEVERLSHLVDGLLALARADAETPHPERMDVASLVRERIDAWAALAAEQQVTLEAVTGGRAWALVTTGCVEQVIDNLLANALEHSPPGSTVVVTAARHAPWIELRVTDEGPGLSPAQRRRAFDRMWRAQGSGEGTGLGLAIVHRLVVADGGQVALHEAPGGGLDAVVRLREAQAPPQPARPQAGAPAPVSQPRLT